MSDRMKWNVNPETGCWEVYYPKPNSKGYIKVKFAKGGTSQVISGHRISYILHHGLIPEGLVIRHKCDVRNCVNPNHLEVGTVADNNRDMSERGRVIAQRGSNHKLSKLTEDQVLEIKTRLKNGESASHIYQDYGVPRRTISAINTGRSWGWLKV